MARACFALATLFLAACGSAAEVPPAHPSKPAARDARTAPSAPAPEAAPAAPAQADSDTGSDDARTAFLLPRDGEWPAGSTPIPGLKQLSSSEATLVARCDAARDKAMTKAKSKSLSKQVAAAMKAMNKVDKRCMSLKWTANGADTAKRHDARAQREMRLIAKGLATNPDACTAGAPNPPRSRDMCLSLMDTMVWDREGWSCVQKGLTDEEIDRFSFGAAYVYSFEVDPELRTYEIVARGCQSPLAGDDGRTELVLRGQLGDATSPEGQIYRRAPTTPAKAR
jgi:hypothetical protein